MSLFDIFVSTHLGIIDLGIIDLGVIDIGIIDLTIDKKHLYTIVPCFSSGCWWESDAYTCDGGGCVSDVLVRGA
jgi:hypothetical protein